MIYYINPLKTNTEEIKRLLLENPNVKFVSLGAVDLGNNHTDERIPIQNFLEDIDAFLNTGVQTDGSSVNLYKIAEINNAKVDIIPDKNIKWFIDYNYDFIDPASGLPVGTLVIPSFLKHSDRFVDSRSILKKASNYFESEIKELVNNSAYLRAELSFEENERIEKVIMTTATELEFWVKTPGSKTDVDKLSTSQILKEQYWKRTIGPVRTAMEQSLLAINNYGLEAEMGHKEVGGVPAKLSGNSTYSHIMEQLEIDWKYDEALQSADHEMLAKDIIREVFVRQGLDVTFMAKPKEGVAGSGEHHHMGAGCITNKGRFVNLFSPADMNTKFMNAIGFGALMGILKNYEVINPFVTSSNDAFNRLKPGFEAPVCTVCSLGHSEDTPSRNRTVLIGLVRDNDNPKATRFELRSPNPNSNSYLTMAASYQAMLDGIKSIAKLEKSYDELLAAISKKYGEESFYLEKDRMYRSEDDVFEHYSDTERDMYFGKRPATPWENICNFEKNSDKLSVLTAGGVFLPEIIDSYTATIINQWTTELRSRLIPNNIDTVRECHKLHDFTDITDIDVVNWEKINHLRFYLMKDSLDVKSLFTKIRTSIETSDYSSVSDLQIEMNDKLKELKDLYFNYKLNLL